MASLPVMLLNTELEGAGVHSVSPRNTTAWVEEAIKQHKEGSAAEKRHAITASADPMIWYIAYAPKHDSR